MKIGCIEYLNALPFTLPFQLGEIPTTHQFIFAGPTEISSLFQKNILEAGLTSVTTSFEKGYYTTPSLGIAADKEILSVNLYTRAPKESLTGKTIGLTSQSSTSISLLQVLAYFFWKQEPLFTALDRTVPLSAYDAFLLIGDEALQHPSFPEYETIDLATEWHSLTGHPFVFATWIFHSPNPSFEEELETALTWSEENLPTVVEEAHRRSHLSRELLFHYYSLCRYRLGEEEKLGLQKFKKYYDQIHALCA
ncbi:MAG: Chorismate dehydratase [Chlamydiae bacterium]|nr:Chorismate dehydratase [Chlamydiota bacterium]